MKRTHGFSLIELMVAITLGLVLLAGVAQVFVNSKQGYRVQESVGRLQENARYASGYLSQYIRMADLWSGSKSNQITVVGTTSVSGPGGCKDTWIVDPTSGIVGYAGDSAGTALSYPANLPAGCLVPTSPAGSSYIQGSDVVAIRYVDPNTYINTTTLKAGSALTTNGSYYLRTQVGGLGTNADLFDVTNNASLTQALSDFPKPATGAADDVVNGVLNFQFQNVVFFLLNADNGQGTTPTLYILTLQSGGLVAQPLVDGIEMMKFEYGIDTNGDFQVDQYAVASAVTDWSKVITVRVSFIARGDALDTYVDSQSYTMNSAGYVYTPAAAVQKYQRRLIVREIQLRNRIRS